MKARSALLGYAVTLGLLELWVGSSGFVWSLGLVCLLVSWIPSHSDPAQSPGLAVLRPGAYALSLAVVAWVGLHGTLSYSAPPPLVTVVRVIALCGVLLVPLTPPSALGLHALGLVVCAWSLATLEPDPSTLGLALGLLLLAGACDGLRRTGSRRSSVTLAVLLLGLLPWLAGAELPRWATAAAATTGRAGPDESLPPDPDGSGDTESGVDPNQVWSTGASARRSMRLIATVVAPKLTEDVLLRTVALERAGQRGFELRRGREPQPDCLQPVQIEATIELAEPISGYLPSVGIPLTASLPHAVVDTGLEATSTLEFPVTYAVTGQVVHPRFVLRGRDTLFRPDLLELPQNLPQDLAALASEAVGTHSSPWAKALAASRWLQARAEYANTEFPEGDLYPRCQAFLNRTRSGVCTEFAAALVVFLRSQGVPCRLVLGFRSDEREPDGTFLVRAKHAHAWVELPLAGAGWVAIDPTPGGSLPVPPPAPPAAEPTSAPPGQGFANTVLHYGRPLLATGVALALLALLTARLRQHLSDRQRGWSAQLDAAGEAQHLPERERWLRLLRARGFRVGGSETPTEYFRRIQAEPSWLTGCALYERVRFGAATSAQVAEFRSWLDAASARTPAAPAPDVPNS